MTKFLNRESCFISEGVILGENVTIFENNHIEGNCFIGDNTVLLPGNYIINSSVGNNCKLQSSIVEDSEVKDNVSIGPFAHLRMNSIIKENCKIGNFVEIKNSDIGKGCKVSHLAYVGDAQLGENCNIGCGAIFVNYNGKSKNKTLVGNHVFIGSNCNIIAPVNIADDSYICAGTTVTTDTESEDFVIGRVRQERKPKRAKKYW